MEEIWKDIKGYEDYYQVSNLGRIKRLYREIKNRNGLIVRKERIIRIQIGTSGYPMVILSINNKQRTFSVHRLVAIAFIANPLGLPCINHKDEDKTNNNVSNLEWCTHKYNSNYGTAKNRIAETKRKNNNIDEIIRKQKETKKKNGSYSAERPVNQFTWDGKFIKRFSSVTEAEISTGAKSIYMCCIGVYAHSGGFIWLYDEDVNSIKEKIIDKNPIKEILQYDKNGIFLKKWKGSAEINKELGISLTALSNCLHGRAKTSGGFIWKYNE